MITWEEKPDNRLNRSASWLPRMGILLKALETSIVNPRCHFMDPQENLRRKANRFGLSKVQSDCKCSRMEIEHLPV